jgi:hypothetical protein
MNLSNQYNTEDVIKIGDYIIKNNCIKIKDNPCMHEIYIDCEWKVMGGDNIYRILKRDGLFNNHFRQYYEQVRRSDEPTNNEKKISEIDRKINKLYKECKELEKKYLKDKYNIELQIHLLKKDRKKLNQISSYDKKIKNIKNKILKM